MPGLRYRCCTALTRLIFMGRERHWTCRFWNRGRAVFTPRGQLVDSARGRPILLIEQHGKRLTALASARQEDVAAAAALVPNILCKSQVRDIRHKLVVETWNERPVTSTAGKELLEAAGFVRDYQAMAWYAVWH